MSRRSCRAARQRIEARQRQQAARDAAAREPDPLERDRMTARHEAELYGSVQIPAGCSFYLRHLGLKDVLPGPPVTHAEHPLPPVLRRSRP